MDATPFQEPHEEHLARLRRWRNGVESDLTLGRLSEHVERHVARPHRQLGRFIPLWRRSVPAELLERTALAGYRRGVLTVHVADSAALYELDRMLRAGLERRLREAAGLTLRRVRLRVAALEARPGG